jgi:uncharacterized membrane protein
MLWRQQLTDAVDKVGGTGEGLGVPWPGEDFAILVIAALFLIVALTAVALRRRASAEAVP